MSSASPSVPSNPGCTAGSGRCALRSTPMRESYLSSEVVRHEYGKRLRRPPRDLASGCAADVAAAGAPRLGARARGGDAAPTGLVDHGPLDVGPKGAASRG